jgi:hypothetical protein
METLFIRQIENKAQRARHVSKHHIQESNVYFDLSGFVAKAWPKGQIVIYRIDILT